MNKVRSYVGFAGIVAAMCVLGTPPFLATADQVPRDKAAELFARAQNAIGVLAQGQTTKTLRAEGVVRRAGDSGSGRSPRRRVEILAIVPSHYLRKESDEYGTRVNGFAENVLLSRFNARGGRAEFSGLGGDFQLQNERQEMARLLLGFFASTAGLTGPKLSLVEPEGRALRVSAAKFECVLELDPKAFVPVRVVYGGPRNPQGPSQAGAAAADRTAATVMSFEDRRLDRGLQVPHRIVRSRNGKTLEEFDFQTVSVNSRVLPGEFTDR